MSAAQLRARQSRRSVPPGAASAKTRNQLCLRRSAGPVSRLLEGMRAPLAGRAGHSAPGALRPALPGAPRLPNLAACAPSGRLTRTACRFQTRATSTISLPCRSFLISRVEINIKVQGPAGKPSQTGRDISATFPHLFWACSSPSHRNSNIFSA